MIVDTNAPSSSLARSAWKRVNTAYRPSTRSAHRTHLKTYLSFVVFMDLPLRFTIHSVIAFLEFLYVKTFLIGSLKIMSHLLEPWQIAMTGTLLSFHTS